MPGCDTAPPVTWLITIAPVPANTSANVPMTSAKYLFIAVPWLLAGGNSCVPGQGSCSLRLGTRGNTPLLPVRILVFEAFLLHCPAFGLVLTSFRISGTA